MRSSAACWSMHGMPAGSPGVLHCCLDEFRRKGPGPGLLCQVGMQGMQHVLAWCCAHWALESCGL